MKCMYHRSRKNSNVKKSDIEAINNIMDGYLIKKLCDNKKKENSNKNKEEESKND